MESKISSFYLVIQIVIAVIDNPVKSARGADWLNKGTQISGSCDFCNVFPP